MSVIQDKLGNINPADIEDLESFYEYVDRFVDKLSQEGLENERNLYSWGKVQLSGYDGALIRHQYYPQSKRFIIYHNRQTIQIFSLAFLGFEGFIDQILSTFKFID